MRQSGGQWNPELLAFLGWTGVCVALPEVVDETTGAKARVRLNGLERAQDGLGPNPPPRTLVVPPTQQ